MELIAWRHPRPQGAEGRCIGSGTDLPVHWRRAKRLARRIQATARRERLPHVVWTSPLRRWGWRHHREASLRELDFGAWEGRRWNEIDAAEIDAWVERFATCSPGGGESLGHMLRRAADFQPAGAKALVVTHGGWMLARRWLAEHGPGVEPSEAREWPAAPAYMQSWRIDDAVPCLKG